MVCRWLNKKNDEKRGEKKNGCYRAEPAIIYRNQLVRAEKQNSLPPEIPLNSSNIYIHKATVQARPAIAVHEGFDWNILTLDSCGLMSETDSTKHDVAGPYKAVRDISVQNRDG